VATRDDSGVSRALDAVGKAHSVVEALRRMDALRAAASRAGRESVPRLTRGLADPADQLVAIAAVHGLGALRHTAGQTRLVGLLDDDRAHLRDHAAWALGGGPPAAAAMDPLCAEVARGGFTGMLAQRTLETWAERVPAGVRRSIGRALLTASGAGGRARLVETLGLVPGRGTVALLLDLASDGGEDPAVRAAAVAALGDVTTADDVDDLRALRTIAEDAGPLGDVARAALHDAWSRSAGRHLPRRGPGAESSRGTVVQLFLHADIDAELSHAGRGDNGGIATLLVQLGDALVAEGGPTSRTVTVSRGRPADALRGLDALPAPGHHYASVPFWGQPVHAAQAWPLRVAARRGIRRILRAAQPVDLVHLRMADVGSLAAAEAAADLGIPTVLTLAPDPHALIQARETAGTLSRENLGDADLTEHLVFRDRLLRDLAARADHLVLFPRPTLAADLTALLGVDITDPSVRATVVAEGVELGGIDRAAATVASIGQPGTALPPALSDLDDLLSALSPERRHLPVALTVGRLHPVKGMATLVETWATRPELNERCNLLVVGGDLVAPTDDEAAELARIGAAVPLAGAAKRGLLLSGHRPNSVVRLWMAAVRRGRPGLASAAGVYVSASLKEEFGIAIIEAMASGLVVVAPAGGGPATYVEDGLTGVLVDTTRRDALGDGVMVALDLGADPAATVCADSARVVLRERFGIDAMATALQGVYRQVTTESQDEDAGWLPVRAAGGAGR
jgi:glycosyltransferase involved in cell wall biosynthesis